MNKTLRGKWAEELAAHWLEIKGYRIIERNFRTRFGELDLIVRSPDGVLCFVEVRSGKNTSPEFVLAKLNWRKYQRLHRTAEAFLAKFYPEQQLCRFDLVAVIEDTEGVQFYHYPNFFGEL